MQKQILSVILAGLLTLIGVVNASAVEPIEAMHITNTSQTTITSAEVETAYQNVLARYRKVLPAEILARIDRSKIVDVAIVEHTSRPDLSDAGMTKALVDLDSGEVETIEIEVQPNYKLNGQRISFQTIIEHEFAHAIAYMIGVQQPEMIGHTFQIEDLAKQNFTPLN